MQQQAKQETTSQWNRQLPQELLVSIEQPDSFDPPSTKASQPSSSMQDVEEPISFSQIWTSKVLGAIQTSEQLQASSDKLASKYFTLDTVQPSSAPKRQTNEYDRVADARVIEKEVRWRKKHLTRMSRRERNASGLFDLVEGTVKFSDLLPLHVLWTGYIVELLDDCLQGAKLAAKEKTKLAKTAAGDVDDGMRIDAEMDVNTHAFDRYHAAELDHAKKDTVFARLVKADYHGALITVVRSTCPGDIGISGIVVKDTENTFQLLTRTNKIKVIPKQNRVFTFVVGSSLFTLYGSQFCVRPADRISKKFKVKATVDF